MPRPEWQPIFQGGPKPIRGQVVLVCGRSGYQAPCQTYMTLAYFDDRRQQPWREMDGNPIAGGEGAKYYNAPSYYRECSQYELPVEL